ncbi:MAG: DEAD/DEAH box helicase [Actinomycetaceae bacterium]|nr:DEAD/DEAH box helicase [Actinomycetaceae bacterium]
MTDQQLHATPSSASSRQDAKTFADFGVSAPICEALAKHGIIHPFPIQALTLPIGMRGKDIIGQAKTGTGKTLGFGIPVLEKVAVPGTAAAAVLEKPGVPQALVVLPTRELAAQVAVDLRQAGELLGVRITEVIGGTPFGRQIRQLKRGCEIVVGTPGRLLDIVKRGHLDLGYVHQLVLDEADEMLNLGFLPDVESLLKRLPDTRQTMLFSATMPGQIISLARRYMNSPMHIRAHSEDDSQATVTTTKQLVYRCHALNKIEVVARILQARERELTIIFANTKRSADRLAADLRHRGFAVVALHGDIHQRGREKALQAFREGQADVLVATDVAARGLDIDGVSHVINLECPEDDATFVHRVGRTGRAGRDGTAITFVDWEDVTKWRVINRQLGLDIPDPVETYHTSPHLYTDLDIPEDATAALPRAERAAVADKTQRQGGARRARRFTANSERTTGERKRVRGRTSERTRKRQNRSRARRAEGADSAE